MDKEYIEILRNISDRSGLFMAVNTYIIRFGLEDTYENRVEVGQTLKLFFSLEIVPVVLLDNGQ